ncbi:MAG: zinc-binding dehydrogenase [Gammaproteobacteria bacterium]|nr:zinc-binding dehydrogenase [Gammaproteobacteria bacterium]
MSETRTPARYRKLVIHQATGDFRSSTSVVDEASRDPGSGEVLIRNEYAGCNAIFDKNLCRNAVRYVDVQPPFDMGVEAVGKIVAVGAGVTEWREGDCVAATRLGSGYREYQIAAASKPIKVRDATAEILALIPSGISAMVGLERIGEVKAGDTVAVSAAAGGLGHFVVQLAKLHGCHVIGITGSNDKLAVLRELGVDRPINYRREDLREVLSREYPRGLDVAYDSVGGEIFDAFVDHVAFRGRVVVSGHTSDFDQEIEFVPQPRAYRKLYWKSASIRGFQNQAFPEFFAEAAARILDLYYQGRLRALVDPTPFTGLDQVADAVEYLLAGKNAGKVVVKLR